MKKRRLFTAIKVVIIISIIAVVLVNGKKTLDEFMMTLPNFEQANVEEVFIGIENDYTYVLLEDEILELETYPKMVEDKLYIPIDFVIERLNDNFFWDGEEQILTYTTKEEVIRMETDELTYYVNNEPLELNMPIVLFDENPFIPVELLHEFCEYDFTYNNDLDLLMIDDLSQNTTYTTVISDDAFLRMGESFENRYIKKLNLEESLKVYGESEEWLKVRTKEGYIGYVNKAFTSGLIVKIESSDAIIETTYNDKKDYNGKICLVWHPIYNSSTNSTVAEKTADLVDVDVLSPTWFALTDEEGGISNLADVGYVDWAHENGYQVWALFSNNFSGTITHEVLSSTAKRESVIKQILAFSSIYDLDGINIDFESVKTEDGPYFVQFIKEITPYLKSQGLIVSVDMYVPTAWTAHYNREEVGEVVDYIMVMAYDEHWSTSPESGPVASIGFVNEGIVNTLAEVPNEKVILGLPFYSRLWKEELVNGEIQVSSTAYKMSSARQHLIDNGAEIVWDEEAGSYYGEYVIGDVTYKMWIEDEAATAERLKLLNEYDLAGAAAWSLSVANDEIWETLSDYLKE
jgi:spore germination protein YaaH